MLPALISQVTPVIDHTVRNACRERYPGHPKGCPNYGKHPHCPPKAPPLSKLLDLNKAVYLIAVSFDLRAHVEKMRLKHPKWTDRQLRNLLYWQPSVNKCLKFHVNEFLKASSALRVVYCPEGTGVNIHETARQVGIILKWPPKDTVWKIALVGVRS
jgi:predicted metal-binding protein